VDRGGPTSPDDVALCTPRSLAAPFRSHQAPLSHRASRAENRVILQAAFVQGRGRSNIFPDRRLPPSCGVNDGPSRFAPASRAKFGPFPVCARTPVGRRASGRVRASTTRFLRTTSPSAARSSSGVGRVGWTTCTSTSGPPAGSSSRAGRYVCGPWRPGLTSIEMIPFLARRITSFPNGPGPGRRVPRARRWAADGPWTPRVGARRRGGNGPGCLRRGPVTALPPGPRSSLACEPGPRADPSSILIVVRQPDHGRSSSRAAKHRQTFFSQDLRDRRGFALGPVARDRGPRGHRPLGSAPRSRALGPLNGGPGRPFFEAHAFEASSVIGGDPRQPAWASRAGERALVYV